MSAEDQIKIIHEMVDESKNEAPEELVRSLEYTINYYPSGTKLKTGSRLDKIVEKERQKAIHQMLEILKLKTKTDLGNDPNIWIKKYKKENS